jgi:hypothetical protein
MDGSPDRSSTALLAPPSAPPVALGGAAAGLAGSPHTHTNASFEHEVEWKVLRRKIFSDVAWLTKPSSKS